MSMIRYFLIVFLVLVVGTVIAHSAEMNNEGNPGTTLEVGTANANQLTFNFSPGVMGQYITEGTTVNEQWYAIVTYHGGGNLFYGSSADSTVVYRKDRSTTQTFTQAAAPTAPADTTKEPAETADDIWGVDLTEDPDPTAWKR